MLMKDICLHFYFLVLSLSGLDIRVMLASQQESGSVPNSSTFGKSLKRIGIISSLYVSQNSIVNPSGPELFFVRKFLITDSNSLLVIGLFIISISMQFSLSRFCISRNLSNIMQLSNLLQNYSQYSLIILFTSVEMSPLSFFNYCESSSLSLSC